MSNDKTAEITETKTGKLFCAVIFIVAVAAAVWIRFHQIGVKPFHHDEGVNAHFLLNLAKPRGEYKYDPTNYHGPTLYYFAYLAQRAFGKTDLALRFTPALFGVLTVLMVWLLRKHLGSIGTPVAAFCLALSPGLVYFSRDFIHEMSFGCFSLGIVVAAWRYAETKNFAWLALTSTSAGLLFATKETAVITAAVLLIAVFSAAIWDIARELIRERQFTPAAFARNLKRDCASVLPSLDHTLAAIIIFVFINIFFYSSLFKHWQGVTDAVKSIVMWTGRSGSEHVKSFWYYLGILFKLELPLLIGWLLAGIFILWRGTRFWLFVAAWTLGMTLAYSIIGYKTPWLVISFLIPMAIVTGYAAERIHRLLPLLSLKLLWAAAMITALTFCWRLAWQVNFEKHDDNDNASGYFKSIGERLKLNGLHGYVYAQTDRDILDLVQAIKDETGKLPSRNHTGIYIASSEHWPLPWYLRDYEGVDYSGRLPVAFGEPLRFSQPIIIANADQQSELDGLPGLRLASRQFKLRPGVKLVFYVNDGVLGK